MAPLSSRSLDLSRSLLADLTKRAVNPEIARLSAQHLMRRGLGVNHTQGVTLGVIVVYAVVIALLWNLPYVRWSLWPFKVRLQPRWVISS
jgi:hypothetical protein